MISLTCIPSTLTDTDLILEMMQSLYSHEGIAFSHEGSKPVLQALLSDSTSGTVFLLTVDQRSAGYMILTYGFSIEYGGKDLLLDELFIRPEYQGKGLGKKAVNYAKDWALANGITCLHLLVDRGNARAEYIYRALGFVDQNREYLTCYLN